MDILYFVYKNFSNLSKQKICKFEVTRIHEWYKCIFFYHSLILCTDFIL